jgi:predicted SprT family Zn-dependent metalloprotease
MRTRTNLEADANCVIIFTWLRFRAIYPQLPRKPPKVIIKSYLREDMAYALIRQNTIKISEKFFASNFELFCNEIIPHEVAHCVAFKIYGDVAHGKKWRKCMKQINLQPLQFYNCIYPE